MIDEPSFPSRGEALRWWPQLSAGFQILLEVLWVAPWFHMLSRTSDFVSHGRVALVLGGIMTLIFMVTRLMENLSLLQKVQMTVLGIILVISILLAESFLLGVPLRSVLSNLVILESSSVLVVFTVLWIWWRGMTLGRDPIRPVVAWRRFELGLLLFMVYLLIGFYSGKQPPGLLWLAVFCLAGFLSVICARIAQMGISRDKRQAPFNWRWFFSLSSLVGVVIMGAALLGGLLTGQYRLVLDSVVDLFRMLVGMIVYIISLPILILLWFVDPFIAWLQELILRLKLIETQDLDAIGYPYPYPVAELHGEIPPISQAMLGVLFWVVMGVIVFVLLLRARRHLMQPKADEPQAMPESLLKPGEARQLLRKALEDALNDLAARLRPVQKILAAAQIRRIYAQLLDLCSRLDRPRPGYLTPLEFLPDLQEIFPALSSELTLITEAYLRIRYGQYPETPVEVDAVIQAWQRISNEGERLMKVGIPRSDGLPLGW